MTSKEQADQLVYWYENLLTPYVNDKNHLNTIAVKCAKLCNKQSIAVLGDTFTAAELYGIKVELEAM